MKASLLYIVVFIFALIAIPMLALNYRADRAAELTPPVHTPAVPAQSQEKMEQSGDAPEEEPPVTEPEVEEPEQKMEVEAKEKEALSVPLASSAHVESFRILDESTGEVREVSLRDFVRGAVAAEMPVSFHAEALKAQAVAAHTFALHNHFMQQESPDPALQGADFSADPDNMKVYTTEAVAREFYGLAADRSWEKICQAADEVLPYVLEYEEEPIVAAYHAISAGQTEDAANVWTGVAPYLLPADSGGDLLAPDYETVETFTPKEIREALAREHPEIKLGDDPSQWFGDPIRSGSGYVTEIPVGNKVLHGKDIRQLLDLRSHNFEIAYAETGFTFRVFGYGHGVGLSQYGADFLARQGYPFDRILENYYSGAVLRRLEMELDAAE